MAFWLVKSEPECWSWQDHLRQGTAVWDGIRNHQANGFLKKMAVGDLALFYHTQSEKAAVGILEVAGLWRPDPADVSGRFGVVDLTAIAPLPQPVTLAQMKADPRLEHLALIKQPRLSVVPIDPPAWTTLLELGGYRNDR